MPQRQMSYQKPTPVWWWILKLTAPLAVGWTIWACLIRHCIWSEPLPGCWTCPGSSLSSLSWIFYLEGGSMVWGIPEASESLISWILIMSFLEGWNSSPIFTISWVWKICHAVWKEPTWRKLLQTAFMCYIHTSKLLDNNQWYSNVLLKYSALSNICHQFQVKYNTQN